MRVTVTDVSNIDPNIFLCLRRGPDAETGDYHDTFEAVCSPVDLEEYPAGSPNPTDHDQFFRVAEIDLLSRNRLMLEDTWSLLLADRDELIRTLIYICQLKLENVSRFGCFPPQPGSSSSTTPTPEPSLSSSAPEACPVDLCQGLVVTSSTDADFPVGAFLRPTSYTPLPPTCSHQFEVDAGITPNRKLRITASMTDHVFLAEEDTGTGWSTVDAGGAGDNYVIMVDLGGSYVQVECGPLPAPSSSSSSSA
jgi:hypothetical protein